MLVSPSPGFVSCIFFPDLPLPAMGPLIAPDCTVIPTTLVDLLSNTLVLRQTAPYLPVSARYALAATCRSLKDIIYNAPEVFRYLDLSNVQSAILRYEPLDSGGISWRAERMDESLTEDEFYSGPVRGILSKLQRRQLLRNVYTMVLDGLSIPTDLVRDIIVEDRFNVRILSIREVRHLNERKLMQTLRYAVRPTRPAGTPRVKGIYFFGPRDPVPIVEEPEPTVYWKKRQNSGSRATAPSLGTKISAAWNQRSTDALNTALTRTEDKWYQSAGRVISKKPSLEWAETLQACEGIITFDAVLCRGPRHDPANSYIQDPGTGAAIFNPSSFLNPAIATVALGPSGCETCHSSPEGPAIFGQSPATYFPLLAPPPLHSRALRAAQLPHTIDGGKPPPLIVRCEGCLKGRWCERCHKWWDEECYTGSAIAQRTELQQTEFIEEIHGDGNTVTKHKIKVYNGLCIEQCLVADGLSNGRRSVMNILNTNPGAPE